ncbi:MAG: YbjQ family protein [Methanobacterium sp.]|nr:YbjQ family protein [Methanobacterium sp.]
MQIFTTSTVLGEHVEKHMGLVTGESLIGANLYKDMLGEVKGVVKKQQTQFEVQLGEARKIAIKSMKEKAEKMGANAIIGTRVEYNNLGGSVGNTIMVTVTGTAVELTNTEMH